MGIRSRSTAPPAPPPPSFMSSLWEEEGHPSTRIRSSSSSPHSNDDTPVFDGLIDDLIVEILSRAPAKSLRRFRCVSKRWLNLIDHPDHRKRLAQPLAGFFYNSTSQNRSPRRALHFVNASGSGRRLFSASFGFLPDRRRLGLLDCCNGLLLLGNWYDDDASTTRAGHSFVVCNPATERWAALPDPSPSSAGSRVVGTARLGFDPAASPHFHVFLLLTNADLYLTGVDVYSSETGTWIHREKGWDEVDVTLAYPSSATVFLNGCLHFRALPRGRQRTRLAAVDTEGGTWSSFDTPCDDRRDHALIQRSHGRLSYISLTRDCLPGQVYLQVHALEDYPNKRWTLKHKIEVDNKAVPVFPWTTQDYFDLIAIHPDRNLIFFSRKSHRAVSHYSIDHRRAQRIRKLGEGHHPPYLPYVPLYSELVSLHA